MKLIHRTNYWGTYIDSSDRDDEVSFDAIWAQAVDDYRGPCCRGFGERSVRVADSDFQEEHNDYWSIFKVSGRRGNNPSHYFYKFVVIPQGIPRYGKKGCASRGWTYIGEFHAQEALAALERKLKRYMEGDTDDFNHVHIGLWMEQLYAPRD